MTAALKASIDGLSGTLQVGGTDVLTFTSAGNITDSVNNTAILKASNLGGTVAGLATAQTFTAKQTFTGTVKLQQALEKLTLTASAPTGVFDCLTQGIQYFTSNASANWTQNFRGDVSTSLDSIMAVGESITTTIMATQGATAYYPSAHQIDGSAVTPKWLGGTAPTSGDASSIDVFTYTIIKTASATFTVLASKSKYA